jgi:hypothetical protein
MSLATLNYFNPLPAEAVFPRKDPGVSQAIRSRHELLALAKQNIYELLTV